MLLKYALCFRFKATSNVKDKLMQAAHGQKNEMHYLFQPEFLFTLHFVLLTDNQNTQIFLLISPSSVICFNICNTHYSSKLCNTNDRDLKGFLVP